jgi:hypothetical protein
MIDEFYLLKAAQIRRNYLDLNKKIDRIEKTIKELPQFLEEHQKDLNDLKAKADKGLVTTKEEISLPLLKIIEELEQKSSNFDKLTTGFEQEMDDLETEEEELFNQIRNKYDLPVSIIKEEINKYLKKQNLL